MGVPYYLAYMDVFTACLHQTMTPSTNTHLTERIITSANKVGVPLFPLTSSFSFAIRGGPYMTLILLTLILSYDASCANPPHVLEAKVRLNSQLVATPQIP